MPDVFDFMGRKIAKAVLETLEVIDGYQEPFRSGGITALEEFWYRATGRHLDWEEIKAEKATSGKAYLLGEEE